MTALDRAIARPPRVPGVVRHSPLAGLDRRSIGFADVVSQSLSATAPAAAATTIPVLVAQQSGGGALWAVAGALLLSLLVASTINQFTRRMSAAGSLYTFTSKGLGTTIGFMTGIGMLVAYGVLTMFALTGSAVFITTILRFVSPGLIEVVPSEAVLVAFVLVVLAGLVFAILGRGIRLSARLTLLIESASVGLIGVLVVAMAIVASSRGAGLDTAWSALGSTPRDAGGFTTAVVVAMMAFVGFESSASIGVEAKRPFATIPRALTWTVIGTGALYLISTYSQIVGFASLGSSLSASAAPVADLSAGFGVEWVGLLLDVSIASSFIACAVASTTALVRVVFAMSRDGLLPARLSDTHPRLGTPVVALAWIIPAISAMSVAVLVTATDAIAAMNVMLVASAAGFLAAYALVCVAAFAFLRKIGELAVVSGTIALGTGALLLAALVVHLVLQSRSDGSVGVMIFVVGMAIGAIVFPILRSRRPWITQSMGQFDETTLDDLLGGLPARDERR